MGRHCSTGATQYSAYPPPASSAQTLSPTLKPPAAASPATISPATSSPGRSEAPAGGGLLPLRWITTGRLLPAEDTLMGTTPGPAFGMGLTMVRGTSGA